MMQQSYQPMMQPTYQPMPGQPMQQQPMMMQQPMQQQPMQQQPGQQPMQTIVMQPMPTMQIQIVQPVATNTWKYGLFDCCEDSNACLCGCFCFPCAAAEITDIVTGNCCIGCWIAACHPCFYPCVGTIPLRAKKGIQGDICNDICTFCWCPPCTVTRDLREARDLRKSMQ